MEFSRQEYWHGLPFPSPGDLPDPGIEPGSPALLADSLPSEPPGMPILPTTPHHTSQTRRKCCSGIYMDEFLRWPYASILTWAQHEIQKSGSGCYRVITESTTGKVRLEPKHGEGDWARDNGMRRKTPVPPQPFCIRIEGYLVRMFYKLRKQELQNGIRVILGKKVPRIPWM